MTGSERRGREAQDLRSAKPRRAADEDVALLERMLEEWSRGEFWNAEPYAQDVVFVRSGPDGGEYEGLDQLAAAWRDFLGAWDDFRIDGEGIVPGRPGMYVLLMRLRGRGKGSGMAIEAEVANLTTLRDGRVVRTAMFWDRGAALREAGAADDAG